MSFADNYTRWPPLRIFDQFLQNSLATTATCYSWSHSPDGWNKLNLDLVPSLLMFKRLKYLELIMLVVDHVLQETGKRIKIYLTDILQALHLAFARGEWRSDFLSTMIAYNDCTSTTGTIRTNPIARAVMKAKKAKKGDAIR
ncbi:MAG: hypothetical protein HPY61_05670 [Methanotrichaceae archaeon]|nr:hypothetical protein [Methanotrichaceae archaeon]